MVTIKDVLCEYKKNPIGIDLKEPRISWVLDAEENNVYQEAYLIDISKDSAFQSIIWSSKWVESDESVNIPIKNLALESRMKYYYRVKVKDNKNRTSDYSTVQCFETGIVTESEWQGNFITAPNHFNVTAPKFTKTIELTQDVEFARVYVTALGLYELSINESRVGADYFTPGWTQYNKRLQYQSYDITDYFTIGENEISALVGNGWYKGNLGWEGRSHIFGDNLALFAEIHINYKDGTKEIIKTDRTWWVENSNLKYSEIYHGESIDHTFISEMKVNVEEINYDFGKLVSQENEPVRKIQEIEPVEFIVTPRGETVVDFGQNMVGWVNLKIQGKPGQKIRLQHAEILDSDGNFYTDNLRTAKQTNTYILSGNSVEEFEPRFSFQGFRYVKLVGFDPSQLILDNFKGVVLHSDFKRTGYLQTSNKEINQLQHNILWGLKGNFLDVPTDCPQRDERLGWTGDAQMFIRTASYLYNVAPFFTKWLADLEADQLDDGSVPFVVPNILESQVAPETKEEMEPYSSAAWGDAAVICPWVIYTTYRDKKILENQYESMKKWIYYIKNQGDNPFLWNTGFHFGDWLALDAQEDSYIGATNREYIATAFYAYSTDIVKKTAKVLGKERDYIEFDRLHKDIKVAFNSEFVDVNNGIKVRTQTAQLLGLKFDLVEGKHKELAINTLEELLNEAGVHLTTGFVGTPYLNLVLSDVGLNDLAYQLLFKKDYPSWLYQVTKGATTVWEHWDGIKEDGSFWSTDMNSFNHYAYGAIGEWLYRKVAGVDVDEDHPGYKRFIVNPHIGEGFDFVSFTFDSMYGRIESKWERNDEGIAVHVTVPVNTTARIILSPVSGVKHVVKEKDDTVLSVLQHQDEIQYEVGSGNYIFHYK